MKTVLCLVLSLFLSGCIWWPGGVRPPQQRGTWVGVVDSTTLYTLEGAPEQVDCLQTMEGPRTRDIQYNQNFVQVPPGTNFLIPSPVIVDSKYRALNVSNWWGKKVKIKGRVIRYPISSSVTRAELRELREYAIDGNRKKEYGWPGVIQTRKGNIVDVFREAKFANGFRAKYDNTIAGPLSFGGGKRCTCFFPVTVRALEPPWDDSNLMAPMFYSDGYDRMVVREEFIARCMRSPKNGPAENDPAGNWGEGASGLAVSLRFKSSASFSTSVVAKVIVRNVSKRTLTIDGENIELAIVDESGERLAPRKKRLSASSSFAERLHGIDQGRTTYLDQLLPCTQIAYLFDLSYKYDFNAGTYSVSACYADRESSEGLRTPVCSEKANITIVGTAGQEW